MIKIKDGTNLKILELYGFKRIINDTYTRRMNNSDNRYETSILVNPLNKEVENQVVYFINNDEKLDEVEEDYIDLTGELDVLYDLFEAGLIEKVGD